LSWGAGKLFRVCYPIHGVRDYTCGYRAYRAGFLRRAFENDKYFIDQPGFSCMIDILLKLDRLGAIMTEVPLVLRYDLKM
jgi:dolichol-phosphate mannosyltransferase